MPSASVPATAKQACGHPRSPPLGMGRADGVERADVGSPGQRGHPGGKWHERAAGSFLGRPPPLAQCLLRCAGAFHHDRSPRPGAPIPMRKQPTGEPCAGDPLARFGGRGGESLPYPYCAGRRGLKVHPNCARRQKMSYLRGFRILITVTKTSTRSAQS